MSPSDRFPKTIKFEIFPEKDTVLSVALKEAANKEAKDSGIELKEALEKIVRKYRKELKDSPGYEPQHTAELEKAVEAVRLELAEKKKS